ncbi:MAG: hypothetical protein RLY16_1939 [Bacteroidota bacterium]|jgi:hypothetical protein
MKYLLLLLSIILVIPNFLGSSTKHSEKAAYAWEKFDERLVAHIQSMDDLENYVDSIAIQQGVNTNSDAYCIIAEHAVESRFKHGYAYYPMHENWLAWAAGRWIWSDLSAMVIPNHILHSPHAACSQQAQVFAELMSLKKIPYRSILFKHHFALEVKPNNKWMFVDVNVEPVYTDSMRGSFAWLQQQQQLEKIYHQRLSPIDIDTLLGKPIYGGINEYPGKKAWWFQQITSWSSHWLWILPLLFFIYPWIKEKW